MESFSCRRFAYKTVECVLLIFGCVTEMGSPVWLVHPVMQAIAYCLLASGSSVLSDMTVPLIVAWPSHYAGRLLSQEPMIKFIGCISWPCVSCVCCACLVYYSPLRTRP